MKQHHLDVIDEGISLTLRIVHSNRVATSNTNITSNRSVTQNKQVHIQIIDQNNNNGQEIEKESIISNQGINNNNNVTQKQTDTNSICKICNTQFSIYSCPRCFIGYCSSICYKDHNDRCTSEFYGEQIRDGLKSIDKASPKDALQLIKKMKDIYDREDQNFEKLLNDNFDDEEGDNDDESDDEPIDISKINFDELNEEQLLSLLTKEEIQEFHQSLKDGTISQSLQEWYPWWLNNITPKIIELDNNQTDNKDIQQNNNNNLNPNLTPIPEINQNIPSLSKIYPGNPSPTLINNLIDIVYAYCFLMRRFNGDWGQKIGEKYDLGELLDGCSVILEISTTLNKNTCQTVFNTSNDSLLTILSKTNNYDKDNYNTIFIIDDVAITIKQKTFILALLSHAHQLFNQSTIDLDKLLKQQNTTTTNTISFTTKDKNMLQLCKFATNKLWFYMAWVNEHVNEDLLNQQSMNIRRFYNDKRRGKI